MRAAFIQEVKKSHLQERSEKDRLSFLLDDAQRVGSKKATILRSFLLGFLRRHGAFFHRFSIPHSAKGDRRPEWAETPAPEAR